MYTHISQLLPLSSSGTSENIPKQGVQPASDFGFKYYYSPKELGLQREMSDSGARA